MMLKQVLRPIQWQAAAVTALWAAWLFAALLPVRPAAAAETERVDRYCLYLTAYNPLDKSTGENQDFNYNALRSELTGFCQWEEKKFYYMPWQSATRQGLSLTLDYLLRMDKNPAVANELMVVLDGFRTDGKNLYLANANGPGDALSFDDLHKKIARHPLRSLVFLLNLWTRDYQPGTIDTLAAQVINPAAALSQGAYVIIADSVSHAQQGTARFQALPEAFQGGADANDDHTITLDELKSYLSANTATTTPPVNLGWKIVHNQPDPFAFSGTPAAIESFTLPTLEGADFRVRADTLRTKPLVMIFGATWCLPCDAEKSDMRTLFNSTQKAFDVIYVSTDLPDKLDLAKTKARGYPFVFLFDPAKLVFSEYNYHEGLPLTVVVDKQNRIVRKKHGYNKSIDGPAYKQLLQRLSK